jgi:hypothetical protein
VSCPVEWQELPDVELGDFTIETVPRRFAEQGDPAEEMDAVSYSLEPLLELVERHESEGLGDAPWPPQFPKAPGEPMRVQPSRARNPAAAKQASGRRVPAHPLITVAKAQHKEDALAGLDRWKERHPATAALLEPGDVLVDTMRGSSSTWTRIRLNLRHVPEGQRPAEEAPDPDYDPWAAFRESDDPEQQARAASHLQTRINPADGRLEPRRGKRKDRDT